MIAGSALVFSVITVQVLSFVDLMAVPAGGQAAAEDNVEHIAFLLGSGESDLAAVRADHAGGEGSQVLFLNHLRLVSLIF